jgi:thiamine biosynthesis lipoprotein
MRLDLGGIAKGYAVDQVLATLAEQGISRALVSGGGDLRGIGHDWKIVVQGLNTKSAQTLTLKALSAATSGDLHKSITIEGREFSHLINPHTGLGLEFRRTVTVLAPDCMTADALASALSILPTQDATRLLTQNYPECSAKILTQNPKDQQLVETVIGNFNQHFTDP